MPVARNGGPQGPSLQPLPKASDFNVAQIVINDVRMNIKKMLLDDTLPPDNMSARSATEVVQRRNELAQNLGAAFGRLITEAMIPIVKRVLFIMDQTGLIDMPLKVNGGEVKIVPISPLAQAQNMDELNDVMQFAQIVAGMGPEAMITIKRDEIIDYVAERLGVPARLLTTQEERERQMAVTRARIEGNSVTTPLAQDVAEITAQSPSEMLRAGAQMAGGDLMGGATNLMRQLAPRLQGMNENVAEQISRSVLDPRFNQQQEFLMGLTPLMDQLRRQALQQQTRAAGTSTSAGQMVPGLLAD